MHLFYKHSPQIPWLIHRPLSSPSVAEPVQTYKKEFNLIIPVVHTSKIIIIMMWTFGVKDTHVRWIKDIVYIYIYMYMYSASYPISWPSHQIHLLNNVYGECIHASLTCDPGLLSQQELVPWTPEYNNTHTHTVTPYLCVIGASWASPTLMWSLGIYIYIYIYIYICTHIIP